MVSKLRTQRIAERIYQELSELLLREVSDPHLVGITVTGAKVDKECSFADVYVSAVEGSERSAEILEALRHAQGFLRTELASRIDLRVFPRLRFHWDATPETADRMERIFAKLRQEKEAEAGTSEMGKPE